VHAPKENAERHADHLTVLCPTTQNSIQTTIATDVRALAKAWQSKIKVSCPHCSEVHKYRVCEAYVEAAISIARLRGELTTVTGPNPLRPHASPPVLPNAGAVKKEAEKEWAR
jgi:hypothetical protein